jgi:UDP-GlcNAc:undecaprenyl-phosphate/decaprenyl-phosphate GlcNAc-1-phosphate transferase
MIVSNSMPSQNLPGKHLLQASSYLFGIQILWLPINGVITLPPSVGQLVTVLIVLVTINAVNFIDGLDGLAAGIVAISGLAFFAFAYLLAVVYGFSRAGAPSLITAILVGVCIGFLAHNTHPAAIFHGRLWLDVLRVDVGSIGNHLDRTGRSKCNLC